LVNVELDTAATKTERGWADGRGFIGPVEPATGPRRDPTGEFPTGPDVGQALPAIVATDQSGNRLDVHADRGTNPTIMVFFRSAVW